MSIIRYYLLNAYDESKTFNILKNLQELNKSIVDLKTEKCYHVEFENDIPLINDNDLKLRWLLKNSQDNDNLTKVSNFSLSHTELDLEIEIGPRFNFSTAYSTNCTSICHNIGLNSIKRLELSVKYLISFNEKFTNSVESIIDALSDKMTQCRYTDDNRPVNSFDEQLPKISEKWYYVPLLTEGRRALENVNQKLGLAFDNWDMDYYTNLFMNDLKRDPTTVELFDCAQCNSEHSRHWFFKGKLIVNNNEIKKSLIDIIIDTQNYTNDNNVIKFNDNSSAIRGYKHKILRPTNFLGPGIIKIDDFESNLIFTAETHNMPTAVAPFSGATTGTGGRIRDVQGVGRGGLTIAGTAGYCVGNLNIPGYEMPFENNIFEYPQSFAKPLKILIEASNGASDYGNKFGEPLINGFTISYGLNNAFNERDEYVKPIMFSGGLGIMDTKQSKKFKPSKGMLLAKIGGPVYRIGVGGGAASSVEIQGVNSSDLDFNAVQRGDAEMENKLNRVVRACIEMGDENPILAIHDQGAGGNGNVLKELVEPGYAGAIIFSKEFQMGDPTITALELWGAEYQENNAILCDFVKRPLLEELCKRERCPINFVGIVTGDGYVKLNETDNLNYDTYDQCHANNNKDKKLPFNMHLKNVLGNMPKKVYHLNKIEKQFLPIELSFDGNNYNVLLKNVLNIVTVGSKRFLTNKVDRCVTGLIAQQQCVGPLHTPLSNYAATTVSYFGYEGIATSIGTQPIKGLINSRAGARMSVAEALTNLVFIKITEIGDIKCSGNWMWAAKLPSEGYKLYETCKEMCSMMNQLNIAIDGGKDSLSMAARVNNETIKSPGTLVISTYAPCPDVRIKVTPDLKSPASGKIGELIWLNVDNKFRIGGSALAQSLGQQGNDAPDIDNIESFKSLFNITQNLLSENKILSGHDISDGGLIVCLIEMAISGLSGINIDLSNVLKKIPINNFITKNFDPLLLILFAEECGLVIEVSQNNLNDIIKLYTNCNINAYHIGQAIGYGLNSTITIKHHESVLVHNSTRNLLKQWEETSYEIEKLQSNKQCAIDEYNSYDYRKGVQYICTFNPDAAIMINKTINNIKIAVIREEGTNGDREMIATFMKSNFIVYDLTMNDLINRKIFLDEFRGVVFPGGFSYADTLGSAKGWAANIMCNDTINKQFTHFKNRKDTFSLGVCNGCQLMSLIGWIGYQSDCNIDNIIDEPNVALLQNNSERYECRWSTLKINKSKSIMLQNMSNSVLGCWIAHGEGKFSFKNNGILNKLKVNQCIALNYVDDEHINTETYPMNPNGSTDGIAGICSFDGRHLAIMPHPERCSIMYQWPYVPHNFNYHKSPWQKMFDEAYQWCLEH